MSEIRFNCAELKAQSREDLRMTRGIYAASIVWLLIRTLPSVVLEGGLVRQLVSVGPDMEAVMQVYMDWMTRDVGFALNLATEIMQVFINFVGFGFAAICLLASRRREHDGMNTLFCGFSSFWRVFSLVVVQSALISLGAMLMVVPGIILACGYSQSYYLLLDHPDWGPMDAMRISRFIMRGRKWAWFKLQLSFLGWLVLSMLTFGLLNIWLDPYMEITNAHFYGTLISRIGEIPGAQTMDGFGREDGVPPDAEDTAPGSDAPDAADAGQKEPKDDRPAPEDFWKP